MWGVGWREVYQEWLTLSEMFVLLSLWKISLCGNSHSPASSTTDLLVRDS